MLITSYVSIGHCLLFCTVIVLLLIGYPHIRKKLIILYFQSKIVLFAHYDAWVFLSFTFRGYIVYIRQNDRVPKSKDRILVKIVYFQSNDRILSAKWSFIYTINVYFTCDPVNDVSLYVSNICVFPICRICFQSNSYVSYIHFLFAKCKLCFQPTMFPMYVSNIHRAKVSNDSTYKPPIKTV